MYPETPVVKKTINYDLFKKIDWNRSIDKGNYQKLLKANREDFQLHRFPILVTKDFQVVDGQHRLAVAKEMGSPVYFIQDGADNSFKAVHSVNKAGKKHTLADKLDMLNRSGDEGAKTIFKVFRLYEGTFSITTVAAVLVVGSTGGSINDQIDQSGSIKLTNYDHGIEVLDAVYRSSMPDKNMARIPIALAILSRRSGIHPKAIVKRVMDNFIKWIEPKSIPETQRIMATCYNYGLTEKNRIKSYVK